MEYPTTWPLNQKLENIFKGKTVNPFGWNRSQPPKDWKKAYFPYITDPKHAESILSDAMKRFAEIHSRLPETFVDLGCGLGSILLLANAMGMKATGVEYSEDYSTKARKAARLRINKHLPIKIVRGDILEWEYKPVDIIYFWEPIADRKIMGKFAQRLVSILPKGQMVVLFGGAWRLNEVVNPECGRTMSNYQEKIFIR